MQKLFDCPMASANYKVSAKKCHISAKVLIAERPRMNVTPSPKAILGKDEFLFLGGADSNELIEHLTGKAQLSARASQLIAANQKVLASHAKRYATLIIPEAHVVYGDKLPENVKILPDRPATAALPHFGKNTLYAADFLCAKRAEGLRVYTGRDSHWSEPAAFATYQELRKMVGVTSDFAPLLQPSYDIEAEDLLQRDKDAAIAQEHRIRAARQTGLGSHVIYNNLILNHGSLAVLENTARTGVALCFGTSFSTRLMAAYASDFRYVVFVYRTSCDPYLIDLLKPDVVFQELPERFVHYPSRARAGGTLMAMLSGALERPRASIHAKDRKIEHPALDWLIRMSETVCLQKLDLDLNSLQGASRYLTPELRAQIEAVVRIMSRIEAQNVNDTVKMRQRRAVRDMVAGYFARPNIAALLRVMIDSGLIEAADSHIFANTEYAEIVGAEDTRSGATKLAARGLARLGLPVHIDSYRRFLRRKLRI